ncbi:MAG: hypothetical protein V1899_06790 [Planctomycetota bacterium]
MTQSYFDAHLFTLASSLSFKEARIGERISSQLLGAVLHGQFTAAVRAQLEQLSPGRIWRHAESLTHIVGSSDSRFPQTDPVVIDLQLPEQELSPRLKITPLDWWPLAEACRGKCFLRLCVAAGGAAVAGPKKLVKAFPQTRFLIDAFRHGPASGWQAHARMAECANVWLTTLGLLPGPQSCWPRTEDVAEALYFTIGEVGAGKLLFASGLSWETLAAADPISWLASVQTLNNSERELILSANARELFSVGWFREL